MMTAVADHLETSNRCVTLHNLQQIGAHHPADGVTQGPPKGHPRATQGFQPDTGPDAVLFIPAQTTGRWRLIVRIEGDRDSATIYAALALDSWSWELGWGEARGLLCCALAA